jgi:type II secretory pathway pseudopilin PulG
MNIRASHTGGRAAAFTMVEIAICLAIIGLALVAIIGVLPLGMNIQRDNREETIINQDATVLLEAIRNGERGGTDLTNYVYAITNYVTPYNQQMQPGKTVVSGYTQDAAQILGYNVSPGLFALTNNACIIGVLSTPEYLNIAFQPTNNLMSGGYSNHVEAFVHAISGPAVEKPPQDNQILVADSFSYIVRVVNSPVATATNMMGLAQQKLLAANLHEVGLSFYWPIRPNGSVGLGRQTQRTMVAGTIQTIPGRQPLYFFESQIFTNAP